ncbi:hypothetical protein SYNPS1DRAFT_20528 [Syncephalis pseudoplumigaleata]|uniref:SPX domain-containing protein n=1 Tax=Syncephalis pseudoplumigaleata TaxID=1712513 RepID=A0A4P9Z869_9FUNG|nr:hypothetical protein SYNPS1DRAFT_20528 [Syncephalis pseudoplumigaleata]|eukprot:RKP28141.1 hypothetical protein SYNPS1DRAFT_20528 [Syncephalis pseudoplumigaleata]
MKFAKQLKAAQQVEWRGQYVDYKLLKQKLHGFAQSTADATATTAEASTASGNRAPSNGADVGAPLTVDRLEELDDAFFVSLRHEADKCEAFYMHLVGQLRIQQQRVFFEDYQAAPFFAHAVPPLGGSPPGNAAAAPGAASPHLTPDAVVAFGQRIVTYAELNKLAIQKILKKHRKRFDAALATLQSTDAQLASKVRDRSMAVEKGVLDTLRRGRAFWTRRDLEAILGETKHVKEKAHLLKCVIP